MLDTESPIQPLETELVPSSPLGNSYAKKSRLVMIVGLAASAAIIIVMSVGFISYRSLRQPADGNNNVVVAQPAPSASPFQNEEPDHISYDSPKAILGGNTIQADNVTMVVYGPSGAALSRDRNDFGPDVAEFIGGEDDSGVELFTISNPRPGIYTVTLAGPAAEPYTLILTYADDNETLGLTKEGALNQEGAARIELARTSKGTLILPPEDLVLLLTRFNDALNMVREKQQITPAGFEELSPLGKQALETARQFQAKATEAGTLHTESLTLYHQLEQHTQAWVSSVRRLFNEGVIHINAGQSILGLMQNIQDTGLASEY